MRVKITAGGQISIPAAVRRRWQVAEVDLEDLGDSIVLKPSTGDPVAAARGALGGATSAELRRRARRDDDHAAR
jgi:AbrB family looped-hinge helix DNA binding protein